MAQIITLREYIENPLVSFWIDPKYRNIADSKILNTPIVTTDEYKKLACVNLELLGIFKELLARMPLRWEQIDSETERIWVGCAIEDKIQIIESDYEPTLVIPEIPEYNIEAQNIVLEDTDDCAVLLGLESKYIYDILQSIAQDSTELVNHIGAKGIRDTIFGIYEIEESQLALRADKLYNAVKSFVLNILVPRVKKLLSIKEITDFEMLLYDAENEIDYWNKIKLDPGIDPLENMWNRSIEKMRGLD